MSNLNIIDFGSHSGKERMTRETAIMKYCVIIEKRGATSFNDMPIPERYKFTDKSSKIDVILNTIQDILYNYEDRICNFENYLNIIKNERSLI